MGVGPALAIPVALDAAGVSLSQASFCTANWRAPSRPKALAPTAARLSQVDVFEINEAFAAQALYCVRKLGVPMEKVNPHGGVPQAP